MSEKERMASRVVSRVEVELLCCHCGAMVLTIWGYGAAEFARSLTGRVICADCDADVKAGRVLPLRAVGGGSGDAGGVP